MDTTLTNHLNVCIQHFTSVTCKHQSNLDWFHSVSNGSLIGFGEIEYDTNISLISRVMSLTLGLPPSLGRKVLIVNRDPYTCAFGSNKRFVNTRWVWNKLFKNKKTNESMSLYAWLRKNTHKVVVLYLLKCIQVLPTCT